MAKPTQSILVLGVGSLLMGDDGVGVRVAHALEHAHLPRNVQVVDGGMGGITLIGLMEDADGVVLVDAADMGKPPGTCVVFSPDEVRSVKKTHPFSLHHTDLLGLLDLMKKLEMRIPAVRVIGVQPERVEWTDVLSKTIADRIPQIVSLVKNEIANLVSLDTVAGSV